MNKDLLSIFSLPRPLPENPYQRLLYGALARRGWELATTRPSLRGILTSRRRGILHVHWIWLKSGALRRRARLAAAEALLGAARRRGWPIVWTAHNAVPHDGDALDLALHRRLAAAADLIFAHTQHAADEVRELLRPAARIEVVPHGHYREAYGPATPRDQARTRLDLPEDRPLLLALGQLRPYKGLRELGERFHRSEIDATLVIAGPPTDPGYVRELAAIARREPRILLRPRFVPDEQLPDWFGAADWAVLPFRRITTSGSVLLALGFGTPVIVPAHPGILEGIEEEARVRFEAEDGDVLAAIRHALTRDLKTASAAALRSTEPLGWDAIAEQVAGHLLALCRRKGLPVPASD